MSVHPSPVAFEPAVQLHLNLEEGRNLEVASFMKTQSWAEERKLSSLCSEGKAGTTQLLYTLFGHRQQVSQHENYFLVTVYAIYWPVEKSQGCLERWCGAQCGKGRDETGDDLMAV